ncbi:MAG: DNA adenine methylase [Candidatus Humimicrobiaceae bacterium]
MFYSPLRYPGGKRKLAAFIKDIITENNLLDGVYIEPFAGGASIALALLFEEYAKKIIINDIDRSIYAFWFSVLNHTDELCRMILDTNINITEWKKQKEVQYKKANANLLELGFSTFFLNRTNWSGIINGGVIGGKAQSGKWTLDVRFNKNDLIMRINKIAYYKERISIYNIDAIDLINNIDVNLPKNTLMYLDPPYYNKSQELYVNFYEHNDHVELRNIIKKNIKHRWILTYDNNNEILKIYKKFQPFEYRLNYSIYNKIKGKELMFFSKNCLFPKNSQIFIK